MKNKGITLVALVITIIILLILAGVTVGLATNGTGLFEKTKLATDEYNNSAEIEKSEINKANNQIEILGTLINSNRDYEPTIYTSQTYNRTTAAVDNGAVSELCLKLPAGTYLVGYEGYIDTPSNVINLYCIEESKYLGNPIIVELNEQKNLTFASGSGGTTRYISVRTYAIKLK